MRARAGTRPRRGPDGVVLHGGTDDGDAAAVRGLARREFVPVGYPRDHAAPGWAGAEGAPRPERGQIRSSSLSSAARCLP